MPSTRASLSTPGWTLATIASLSLLSQLPNLYDPSNFMKQFDIASAPAARLVAFCLVLVNSYDLLGAIQDNYSVYYFSLLSRAAAVGLFWAFGPVWHAMVGLEGATLVMLGAAVIWEKR